jgi:hypothetical protein
VQTGRLKPVAFRPRERVRPSNDPPVVPCGAPSSLPLRYRIASCGRYYGFEAQRGRGSCRGAWPCVPHRSCAERAEAATNEAGMLLMGKRIEKCGPFAAALSTRRAPGIRRIRGRRPTAGEGRDPGTNREMLFEPIWWLDALAGLENGAGMLPGLKRLASASATDPYWPRLASDDGVGSQRRSSWATPTGVPGVAGGRLLRLRSKLEC